MFSPIPFASTNSRGGSQEQERVVDGVVGGSTAVLAVHFLRIEQVPAKCLQHSLDEHDLRVLLADALAWAAVPVEPFRARLDRLAQVRHAASVVPRSHVLVAPAITAPGHPIGGTHPERGTVR